ncbi:MAG: hypothetical protein JWN07_1314 [Hyphomicrobiales bacterium]|nr:hypothetical protein [Hyphomicrobiales bacterium]
MLMPSIALPTGPYDWNPTSPPRATYETRLSRLRETMRARGLSHVIVYGNTFDHEALAWFSHMTPKLGPALMLVGQEGAPRLVFAGGPGMKPSAARLTWIEDVTALRGLDKEVAAWLDGASEPRIGLVSGASILQGDFDALQKGAGRPLVELDVSRPFGEVEASVRASARLLQVVADHLYREAKEGADAGALALGAERLAYATGAQDVRLRLARKPFGAPVTLPDAPMLIALPAPVALAVRYDGYWAAANFMLGDIAGLAPAVSASLEASREWRAYANRVAFPEPPLAEDGLVQAFATVEGARFSAPCIAGAGRRDWLFCPPGLKLAGC